MVIKPENKQPCSVVSCLLDVWIDNGERTGARWAERHLLCIPRVKQCGEKKKGDLKKTQEAFENFWFGCLKNK